LIGVFDNHEGDEKYTDWRKYSSKLIKHLHKKYSLSTIHEMSGSLGSVHLIVPLEPTNTKKVREFAKHVQEEIGINVEIFPKNDTLKGKDVGNLIKLPCGIHLKNGRRSKLLFPDIGKPLSKHKFRDDLTVNYLVEIKPQKLPEIPTNK